jgi:hypothetical protein
MPDFSKLATGDPCSIMALSMTGLKDAQLGFYKDAYFTKQDNNIQVAVLTRNGIRENCWGFDCPNSKICCPQCIPKFADKLFVNFIRNEKGGNVRKNIIPYDPATSYFTFYPPPDNSQNENDPAFITMYFSILPEFETDLVKCIEDNPEFLDREETQSRNKKVYKLMDNDWKF